MAHPRTSAALAVLFVAPFGCGGNSPASARGPTGPTLPTGDAGADAGPGAACDPAGPPVALAGTWAIRASLALELTSRPDGFIVLCPDPQPTTASLLLRMAVTMEGTRATQSVQVCQVNLPEARGAIGGCGSSVQTIQLRAAPAFAASLPRFTIPPIVTDVASTRPCAPYHPAAFTVLLGVRAGALADADHDRLPAWCSPCEGTTAAQCVCRDCAHTGAACASRAGDGEDTDGDGHPGVSVRVATNDAAMLLQGEAYLAFRTRPQLDGRFLGPDRIAGGLTASLDYTVLGSDVRVALGPLETAQLVGALPDFRFLPDQNEFVMLRADGAGLARWDANGDGAVTCDDILARANNFSR